MGVKVIRIYQLDGVVNARLELQGGFFEVEVPAGPVAGGYMNKRLSYEQMAELLGGTSSPNHSPSLLKSYRYLTRAEVTAGGGDGEAFEDLDYATCCINTRIKVDFYQPDPAGPLTFGQWLVAVWDQNGYQNPAHYVFVDGGFRVGDKTPAKFVPEGSPEAKYGYVRRDTAPATIADWRVGELSIWSIGGADQFATAKQAGGVFPAFTGVEDAYWKPAAAPVLPAPNLLKSDNRWTGTNLYEQGLLLASLGGAPDLGLRRSSAGVLEINTGVAGSAATVSAMDFVAQAAPAAYNSFTKLVNKMMAAEARLGTTTSTDTAAPLSSLVWQFVGAAANRNVSLGKFDASNVLGTSAFRNRFGASFQANTIGNLASDNIFENGCYYLTIGNRFTQNVLGAVCAQNVFGDNNARNTLGSQVQFLNTGNDCTDNTFASGTGYITLGNSVVGCRVGPGCLAVALGDGCQRVELYNCGGTGYTQDNPFRVAAGTKDVVYRNNVLVGSGSGTGTVKTVDGTAPDGAGNVALPLASTTVAGKVRLSTSGGIRVSGTTGVLRNEAVFYTTELEYVYDSGQTQQAVFGLAVALTNFPTVTLIAPTDTTRLGFVSAIRNRSAAQVTSIVTDGPTIEGKASFALGPGEQVWIKYTTTGDYQVVLYTGGRSAAGGTATLLTSTYTAGAAGTQTIAVAGATAFFDVGIRTAGGKSIPLDPGTGYTVAAGQLTILAAAGVQAGDVLTYSYATGSVQGGAGGPTYTAGKGIDITNNVISSKPANTPLSTYNRARLTAISPAFQTSRQRLIFDNVLAGTAINNQGLFTCPVAGLWRFDAVVVAFNFSAPTYLHISFLKNSQVVGEVGEGFENPSVRTYISGVPLQLAAGDVVEIIYATNTSTSAAIYGTPDGEVTTMTCYLISAA